MTVDHRKIARQMLDNPLSGRLVDGWYPSGRDEDGNVVHDRHVLTWVRNYEWLLDQLTADEVDEATS